MLPFVHSRIHYKEVHGRVPGTVLGHGHGVMTKTVIAPTVTGAENLVGKAHIFLSNHD